MRVSASWGWYGLTGLIHRICLGQNLIHIWLIITGIIKPEICLTDLHFFTFDQSGLFGGNSCLPRDMKSITLSLSLRIHIIFCSLVAHCWCPLDVALNVYYPELKSYLCVSFYLCILLYPFSLFSPWWLL